MSYWKWFEVSFDLGVEADTTIPEDPVQFIKWLFTEPTKFIEGLALRPARLVTSYLEDPGQLPENVND